jgi:hypothetical protein
MLGDATDWRRVRTSEMRKSGTDIYGDDPEKEIWIPITAMGERVNCKYL